MFIVIFPLKAGSAKLAFKANAVVAALLSGKSLGAVLATFPSPTILEVMPMTSLLKVAVALTVKLLRTETLYGKVGLALSALRSRPKLN